MFTQKLRQDSEIKKQSTANKVRKGKGREGHNMQGTKQERSVSSEEHTEKGAGLFVNP